MKKKESRFQAFDAAFLVAAVGILVMGLSAMLPQRVMANDYPVVVSVSVKDASNNDLTTTGLHPISGGTTDVTVSGQVSDADYCTDIDNVTVYLARSGAWPMTGAPCSADNNNCYVAIIPAASLTNCTGRETTANYSATFQTTNYIDPTDTGTYASDTWMAVVRVTDASETSATDNATTFETYSLASFTATSEIDFGTLQLDGYSGYEAVTFTNNGNTSLDAYIRADGPMTSDLQGFAVIPEGNVHYSMQDTFDYGRGTAMTTSDVFLPVQLPQQTIVDGGIPPTKNVYFKLHMPASGVKGPYRNILTFTAAPY